MYNIKSVLVKCLMLLLFVSTKVFAQKEHVYSKVFETDIETTAILNISESSVSIESSPDDKVYVDYYLEFEGYSIEEINKLKKEFNIESNLNFNHLTILVGELPESNNVIIEDNKEIINVGINRQEDKINNQLVNYKSKDSLLSEIKVDKSRKKSLGEVWKKLKDKISKIKGVSNYSIKAFETNLIIKVPSSLKFTINGRKSFITLNELINGELSINLKGGKLRAKNLQNVKRVKIVDAGFEVEEIKNGIFNLSSVRSGKIGSIKNASITSEFSKIEIGEVKERVVINDFNSEYKFYNFSSNFKQFDLFSEYSKVHIFDSEFDYSFKVIGNNTVFYNGETAISMQPTKNGEKFTMIEKKSNDVNSFGGHINMDIIHGAIYSHKNKKKSE